MAKYVDVLGFKITTQAKNEIINNITESLRNKQRILVFTPNPKMISIAQKDIEQRRALCSADLLLPDGIGVVLASKILQPSVKERICGIDTAQEIIALSVKNGYRIFLLGGKKGVAENAKRNLEMRYKGINICGIHHGYFEKSGKENDGIIEKINDAAPDILFVCFGTPIQEKWIYDNQSILPSVNLFMGIGGSLDVWAGKIKRAPRIIRALSLEWLWRVIIEPKRFKDLLCISSFFISIFTQKLSKTRSYKKKQS